MLKETILSLYTCLFIVQVNIRIYKVEASLVEPHRTAINREYPDRHEDLPINNEQDLNTNHNEGGQASNSKRLFASELLKMLHEQYVTDKTSGRTGTVTKKSDSPNDRQTSMNGLLSALGADGDSRRLIDWVKNSFNLASIGELTTQFVVSKLGSVNCAAILEPDSEEKLIPRFLLFNEHFVDVPFEFPLKPNSNDCLKSAKFDPKRKTLILIHGYLAGYALVDGLTNIKNRLLDLNKRVDEIKFDLLKGGNRAGAYNDTVLLDNIEDKVRQQQYNVIVVDWFNGANPVPRANYIRSAVNSQVVGRLIARFLRTLAEQCGTPSLNFHIIAHSLGCHVAGFTGKAMSAAGHKLGKITHLDPIGLCFGRLFSEPRFRLNPNDAMDTQAVHVSLNIFDNPLDGTKSNFLVNGGRDQIGCGGQSELKNSTGSSVALLFDSEAKFVPCSHMRALALFEDDLSSAPGQCQIVGYKCANYNRFLMGKCGRCDLANNQCKLMSLPPISLNFKRLNIGARRSVQLTEDVLNINRTDAILRRRSDDPEAAGLERPSGANSNESVEDNQLEGLEQLVPDRELVRVRRSTGVMIAQTIGKIRANTMNNLLDGLTQINSADSKSPISSMKEQRQGYKSRDKQPYGELRTELPVGSQPMPEGAVSGPLYYVGTGPITPYCVNYYQFRMLIAEARLKRMLIDNKLAPSVLSQRGPLLPETTRDMLHMTIKLSDSDGHFFKGFTLFEEARGLQKFPIESRTLRQVSGSDSMFELTMLLNTTSQEPVRIGEAVISYYFHRIVLADMIEINYMSNISPN